MVPNHPYFVEIVGTSSDGQAFQEHLMFPEISPNLAYYLTIGFFVVVAMFGLPMAIRVWNDTRHGVDEGTDTPRDLLTPLEDAFYSGQMSEEEYKKIKESVGKVLAPSDSVSVPLFEKPRKKPSTTPGAKMSDDLEASE